MVEVFGDADRDAPNILPTNDVVVDHGNGELVVAIAASLIDAGAADRDVPNILSTHVVDHGSKHDVPATAGAILSRAMSYCLVQLKSSLP